MILELNIANGRDTCFCDVLRKSLRMLTTDLLDPGYYPVEVFDVNLVSIGIALNKDQYIGIWNSSLDNNNVGYLIGDTGLFSFILVKHNGPLPNQVYGNPLPMPDMGEFNDDFNDDFNI